MEIQNLDIFLGISASSMQYVRSKIAFMNFEKNQLISDYINSGSFVIYILNGWIKYYNEQYNGNEHVIHILTKNNLIGENLLSAKNVKFKSITNSKILIIPKSVISTLIIKEHRFAINYIKNLIYKINDLYYEKELLSTKNSVEKICCFILRNSIKTGSKRTSVIPYSKKLLAEQLNISPETLSRSIKEISNIFKVNISNNKIIIEDNYSIINNVCNKCSNKFPCGKQNKFDLNQDIK
ncbi:MAG: Crp/Fnr family transcriptional regulator [Legionellales bacterium]|nr:Crp/Fnr family transcriptional regulator [Legionellales bacterium]